jgi:tRNA(Ile)-lysidine synthase
VNAFSRLVADVRCTLLTLPEIERGLVVAVSGGPDSVALLRVLLDARPPQTPLVVAHLDHQLRGSDSDADADFVATMQATLAAQFPPLHIAVERRDVAAEAQACGANLEGHARTIRYRWLAEMARRHDMRWLATGHTANDQAETVLHRLLRGTGLQGLRGIAPRRELEPGIKVVRPLLNWTRADVLAYLDELGQTYRIDATNADRSRTRNRIRHELLPLLAEQYNPAIVSLLGRLAQQAEEAFHEEDAAARQLLCEVELPRAGTMLVVDRVQLAKASRHRVRQVFRLIWQRENWSLDAMSHAAWERLATLVLEESGAVDFPSKIRARALPHVVQLQPVSG